MPAHLRGLFTGNAANNLIDPWLARSRQEIMGKIKSLDKGEFRGHVEDVVERCLSGVTLHPVDSGRAEIGRARAWTPGTNAHLVCRLLLEHKTSDTIYLIK